MTNCKVWGHTTVISEQEKQRERDHRFRVNVGYTPSTRTLRKGLLIPLEFLIPLHNPSHKERESKREKETDREKQRERHRERQRGRQTQTSHCCPYNVNSCWRNIWFLAPGGIFSQGGHQGRQSTHQQSLGKTAFRKYWFIPPSSVFSREHHFILDFFIQLLHIPFV